MKKLLFGLIIVSLSLTYFSCKSNKATEECAQCKPVQPHKVISLKLGNLDRTFKVWTGAQEKNKNLNYSFARDKATASKEEMINTANYYGLDISNIIGSNNLVSIVYYGVIRDGANELKRENVIGALVYTSDANRMIENVFAVKNGKFSEIESLRGQTAGIKTNDIYLASLVFGVKDNITAFQIANNELVVKKPKAKANFQHKLNKYFDISYLKGAHTNGFSTLDIYHMEHAGYTHCGYPCGQGSGGCIEEHGDFFCEDDVVPLCATVAMQPYNSYSEANDPRYPVFYAFRDNILLNSPVGVHIKNDFYYCGQFLLGTISAQQAIDGYALMDSKIVPAINKLLAPGAASDNSIIYDNTTRDEILDYVNDIATLSTDATFQEIMTEIRTNVNYMAGKTVKQIYTDLQ